MVHRKLYKGCLSVLIVRIVIIPMFSSLDSTPFYFVCFFFKEVCVLQQYIIGQYMYQYQRYFSPLLRLFLSVMVYCFFFWVLYVFLLIIFSLQTTQNTFAAIDGMNTRRTIVMRVSLSIFIMWNVCFFSFTFFALGRTDWGFDFGFGFSFLFNFRKIHPWFCNVLRIGLVRFTFIFGHFFSLRLHINEVNTSALRTWFWIREKTKPQTLRENVSEQTNERTGRWTSERRHKRTRDEGTTKGHHRMDNKIKRNGEPTKGPCKI